MHYPLYLCSSFIFEHVIPVIFLVIYPGVVTCAACTQNGLSILTGGTDAMVRLWTFEEGKKVWPFICRPEIKSVTLTGIKPLPLANGHGRYMLHVTVTPERTIVSAGRWGWGMFLLHLVFRTQLVLTVLEYFLLRTRSYCACDFLRRSFLLCLRIFPELVLTALGLPYSTRPYCTWIFFSGDILTVLDIFHWTRSYRAWDFC